MINERVLIQNYINYIISDLKLNDYTLLLSELFYRKFEVVVKEDESRIGDAMCYREEYLMNNVPDVNDRAYILEQPCNVLEVFAAFADRIDRKFLFNEQYGIRAGLWVCIMLHNLDILHYTDSLQHIWFGQDNENDCLSVIHDKLSVFMDRTYAFSGNNGGLFPLRYALQDQRLVELWWQVNRYILENFDLLYNMDPMDFVSQLQNLA